MRLTRIITAKVKPGIYRLIESGEKTLEVRDDSYQGADAIRYVNCVNGRYLGTYRIDAVSSLPMDCQIDREIAMNAARVGRQEFDRLFPAENFPPGHPVEVALIGERIDDYQRLFEQEETE
jgi:hypothetical protein